MKKYHNMTLLQVSVSISLFTALPDVYTKALNEDFSHTAYLLPWKKNSRGSILKGAGRGSGQYLSGIPKPYIFWNFGSIERHCQFNSCKEAIIDGLPVCDRGSSIFPGPPFYTRQKILAPFWCLYSGWCLGQWSRLAPYIKLFIQHPISTRTH